MKILTFDGVFGSARLVRKRGSFANLFAKEWR